MPHLVKISLLFICLMTPVFQANAQSTASSEDLADTLQSIRKGLTTSLYQDGKKLSYQELLELYKHTPQGLEPLKWSRPLRIAGPVVALGGIALGAVALKGEQRWAYLESGDYYYTYRSKPKLLGGLILLAGGLCLFELSNDLVTRSGNAYNKAYLAKKLMSDAKVGITPSGGIGIVASF